MPLNDVPQAAQTLAQTQNPIRQNFLTINNAFQIDHVAYVNAADVNNGKHNKVTLPVQALMPAFLAGEEGIYNFLNPTTNKNEIYVHKQNLVGTAEIPMTAGILGRVAAPLPFTGGWTYLPSGLLIKFGESAANIGNTIINLNAAAPGFGPAFTGVMIPLVSPNNAGMDLFVFNLTAAPNFQLTVTSLVVGSFNWMVIGY